MADEGGANGTPANQTDDVRCHLLVGQFRYGGVELLGSETLPFQRQAQILQVRPGQFLWPGADDVQRRNFVDMVLYIVSKGIQIVFWAAAVGPGLPK